MQKNDLQINHTIPYSHSQETNLKQKEITITHLFIKRSIDVIGAMTGLILMTPFFVIILFMYLITDPHGNLFFKQQRYGQDGRIFFIYKFRTMVKDADEKLKSNQELYRKYLANNYKLEQEEDPRITKLGRFLRRTSLDELPQLINVLKGDMSLVGPRPIVKEELLEYKHRQTEFLSVKPGMTGYWQISGRSGVGYPERVDLELYYVYNQSIYFDIKILLMTIVVVFLKKGAY